MLTKSAASSLPVVKISRRGAKRLQDGHVWVYRSDIVSEIGVERGTAVGVTDERGKFLGTALYSSASQIAIRMISSHSVDDLARLLRERIQNNSTGRRRIMDRIWVKHYPAGVPADVDAGQYPSLVALFEESFAKYKNANAYACMDKKLTYAQLDEMSRALGAWLQSKGLQRGDRVAIMMPNVLQYPVCVAGILRAGYVVVNVNPLYTPRELEHQLKDLGRQGHHHHRELRQDAWSRCWPRRPCSTSCWRAWAICSASPRARSSTWWCAR